MRLDDAIVAPITGLTRAAVAVIRVSGPEAWRIASELMVSPPGVIESHRAYYGRLVGVEDGIVLFFAEGRSYTGQESAEISVHGSPASVRLVVEQCVRAGARRAEPGEFTWRAFANGRIDLTQAESVRDTIEAETDAQLAVAKIGRYGGLKEQVQLAVRFLMSVLASAEAHVDFSEEIGEPDLGAWRRQLSSAHAIVNRLESSAHAGQILRRGLRIAIVGRPNAGKSSLLNALLRSDRAIVSSTPGTTRDFIEEKAEIGGLPCVLIDTAGLRETGDEIEAEGVQRAREAILGADFVWYVFDAAAGWTPEDEDLLRETGSNALVLATKSDLATADRGLSVSSLTRAGLEELQKWVRDQAPPLDSAPIRERHEEPLARAEGAIRLAEDAIENDLPYDLIATALREAIDGLGEITGETASADMIERIFADFCIGK